MILFKIKIAGLKDFLLLIHLIKMKEIDPAFSKQRGRDNSVIELK